jgi:hypothetical protein
VVDHHALDRGDDHVACLVVCFLARLALDRPRESDGILLGLAAHLLDEHLLGLVLRHLADPFQGGDLLLARVGQLFLGLVDLALARDELSVALLERVRALIQAARHAAVGAARAWKARRAWSLPSSSSSRCMRICSSLACRMSSFCCARASARMRAALSCATRIALRRKQATREKAHGKSDDGDYRHHRQHDGVSHLSASRPAVRWRYV